MTSSVISSVRPASSATWPSASNAASAVGDIVAAAAPGVEQPGLLAGRLVEQPAGERETLAALADRLPRQRHQFLAFASAADLPRRRAQDARRGERTRAEGTR